MTLNETIDFLKTKKIVATYNFQGFTVNEMHSLINWLEELKFLRNWKSDVMEDFYKYDCDSVNEVAYVAYNKAIDDFLKLCSYKTFSKYENEDGYMSFNNISLMLKDLSDKLKGVSK